MKKPSQQQTWVGVAFAALTLISGFLGVDKYQQSQIVVEAPDIKVNVTSLPAHGAHRSEQDVKTMIDKAIKQAIKDHEHGGKFH